MFQQDGGGICLPAPLSKSHRDSMLGVVGWVNCGSRAKTLCFPAAEHAYTITDMDRQHTEEHSHTA